MLQKNKINLVKNPIVKQFLQCLCLVLVFNAFFLTFEAVGLKFLNSEIEAVFFAGDMIVGICVLFGLLCNIFLPVGIIFFFFIEKKKGIFFIVEILMTLSLAFLGSFLRYISWKISENQFLNHNPKSSLGFVILLFLNFWSVMILGLIFQIILWVRNKKQKVVKNAKNM
ncbi:MAG: hypothetical protein K6E69_05020 [Treponema sp.]|uniref:hypothetical protein n=1 Tax=Treponema sp. TaxID=166 RepID=UPI00298D6730|nr:hypothetical protein [Treponema sp.]MCR5386461.1 hypothetical protein [Treponema sp.]